MKATSRRAAGNPNVRNFVLTALALLALLAGVAHYATANVPKPVQNVIPEIEGKPGRNGLIVFVQNQRKWVDDQGPAGIYIYDPRSRKRTLLVKSKHASHPRFTADGDKIIFVDEVDQESRVFSMNPNGSGKTEIASDLIDYPPPAVVPGNRVWFMNSKRVAGTVNSDGSGYREIGKIKGEVTVGSATADGRKVVYPSESGKPNVDIFIFSKSTGKHTRLTNGPKWEWQPRISPNGRWVTYLDDSWNVWKMRTNGKDKKRVIYTTGDLSLGEPMFSPDGRKMLMQVFYGRIATYLSYFSLANVSRNGPFFDIKREGSVDLTDADWQSR